MIVMGATKRARSGSSTRERIVAAAEQLIDELGIEKANVADIADHAGIHRVTVYRYFADRNAVIDEVLLRRSEPVLKRAAARLATATRFPDDLAYTMVAAVDEARHIPGLLRALSPIQDGDKLTTRLVSDRYWERTIAFMQPYLEGAQERGEMRQELSIEDTARWLLQVCATWLLLTPDESPARMLEMCNTYVMPPLVAR